MKRQTPYLLVHAFEFALALSLAVVALIFTAFPEALNHEPVGGFENRGIIHHGFHYMLLAGSFAMLAGLVGLRPRVEMVGLILLAGALTMNLIGLVTSGPGSLEPTGLGSEDIPGLGFALRVAVLIGLFSRLYLIAFYLPRLAARIRDL